MQKKTRNVDEREWEEEVTGRDESDEQVTVIVERRE